MTFRGDVVRDELAARADDDTAWRHSKQVTCLRGIRGVPTGEIARAIDRAWRASPPVLPDDAGALMSLFSGAWEDGLAAVALLAAVAADAPESALAVALDLASRTDDNATADALGHLVFGPLSAHLHRPYHKLVSPLLDHPRADVRRIAVSGGLAFTPLVVEGPTAAALRARHGQAKIRISDGVDAVVLGWLVQTFARDEGVGRAVRRLIVVWGQHDVDGLVAFSRTVRGGLPAPLAAEVRKFRE